MSELNTHKHYQDLAQRLSARQNPDLDWLVQARMDKLNQFFERGVPTRRDESWKYTDINPLFQLPLQLPQVQPTQSVSCAKGDAIELLFVDGQLTTTPEDLPVGLCIESVTAALARDDSGLKAELTDASPNHDMPFMVFNQALFLGGVVITLSPGFVLDKPLVLRYKASAKAEDCVLPVHNRIELQAGASATMFEEYTGVASGYFSQISTTVTLAEKAKLRFYKIQTESKGAFHLANFTLKQHQGSHASCFTYSAGSELARENIKVSLLEPEAKVQLFGLYQGTGAVHLDQQTKIEHLAPDCQSEEHYRGILDDKSHAIFNGKVLVDKGAIGTQTEQENHNLLLSRGAEIDTKPELVIYADDVTCAHGATVGQLDDKALFYLRSRGIPVDMGRKMLTAAFADAVLNELQDSWVADCVREHQDD